MKHQSFWTRFFLIASILSAVVIFCFSAQNGEDSTELSDGVTLQVAQVVRPDYVKLPAPARKSFLESLSHIVRKCAHFLEFALLGFNLMGFLRLRRLNAGWPACMSLAWGIAALYAATDELHQMFSEERAARGLDVLIDSSGALCGVLVAALLLALCLRRASRTQNAV